MVDGVRNNRSKAIQIERRNASQESHFDNAQKFCNIIIIIDRIVSDCAGDPE